MVKSNFFTFFYLYIMKKDRGAVYIFTKVVKDEHGDEYTISIQKTYVDIEDAIDYARENNYAIIDALGKAIIYKN